MFKWLPEGLRSWLFPPSSCPREVGPSSLLRPRKRRYPSTQLNVDDPGQEQIKRQKLGIFHVFSQGIVSLIKLPIQLTAKYLLTGDQHVEATAEVFPKPDTVDIDLLEPTSGMHMIELDKKATDGTSEHLNEGMTHNCSGVMPFLRNDCGTRKKFVTNHSSSEDLLPWETAVCRHWSDAPPMSSGRLLKKPHSTVEEGVQIDEREKYKQLLEQEKEKSPKNYSTATIARHSNSVLVTESSPEKKLIAQRKKHPSASDLSEEVLLRLNLGHEGSSCRKCSQVDLDEQKDLSWDKTTQCLPPLSEDMEREIANVLSHGPEDEILSSAFKLKITRGDIQTLRNQHWLNDVIIDFYMNLLVERNKRLGLPVLYAFSTFFYPKLRNEGYNAVRKWTKGVDLFQHDMILVPVHIQVHWGLLVVDMRRGTIRYFDSMGHNGHRICKRLLQYLQEESKAKRNLNINASSWTLYSMKQHEIPQQLNGSDCGIFACKYADFISRDKPIMFTQHHMPYFRRRMIWEILHQQLL